MRIAIINITGGGMSSGYRKYLRNVIPRIAANPNIESLLCATPPSVNIQSWFNPLPDAELVSCKPFSFLQRGSDSELKYHLEKFLPDVIFVPTERFSRLNNIPIVNMIQNMEPFVAGIGGNPISERFKNLVRNIDGKRTLKRANRVIAISEYVRDFLIQNWNIQNDKIGLVYHGVELPKNEDIHRPHVIPKGWDGHFLFTAGSIRPARGLEDAIKALKYLPNKLNLRGLVIAGETIRSMRHYQSQLINWLQENSLASKILWAGSLNEYEMSWCYQNCYAFIMTSRVEACPNIALEAMANGSICISTDSRPMPEIFFDTAIYYPAKNGKALAETIETVTNWDDIKRKEMSEKAKRRAAEFSWDVCAERTVAELAKAARR